jgi:hypothetical protein
MRLIEIDKIRLPHKFRMMRIRFSISSIIGSAKVPISCRNDSLATAITWARSRSLSRATPPWPFLRRNRRIPEFSTRRVVVGMTIVDGYPASLTRSDWSTRAGRSLPGFVFMRGLKSIMYRCPRLMAIYSRRFVRATPAINNSLFSSRSAAAQRFTESRISRRNFSSWLFFSKVFRAARISPDLLAIPSSLRNFSICSSSFFDTAIAPITHLIRKLVTSFIRHLMTEFNRSGTKARQLQRLVLFHSPACNQVRRDKCRVTSRFETQKKT